MVTATIPRAELQAIGERHGDEHWAGNGSDPEAWTIRAAAGLLRQSHDPDYHAEADDLDVLVDRYEREANA